MFDRLRNTMLWYLFVVLFSTNFISAIKSDDEAFHWESESYPAPIGNQAKFCTGHIRNPPTSICDPDLILSKRDANILDQLIDEVKNDTKCLCESCPPNKNGLNIKIALVKFVRVYPNATLDRSVEIFAERTRRKWKFGEECSNDVLIFFAALDDRIYVSLGVKARKVLPEEEVQRILSETKMHFTSGSYQQGLESIIASFQDLANSYEPKSSKLGLGAIVLIVFVVGILTIVILFGVFWFFVKKDRNSLSGSFEFIGSWGRNRNKNKTQVKPKLDPIYKPVKTTDISKPVIDPSTGKGKEENI